MPVAKPLPKQLRGQGSLRIHLKLLDWDRLFYAILHVPHLHAWQGSKQENPATIGGWTYS